MAVYTQILTLVAKFSASPWFPQKEYGSSGTLGPSSEQEILNYVAHHQQEKVFPVS